MSLQTLRSFVEVYRSRSITAAAQNLGLTQPAVSQHVAALEAQVGRTLFLRQARGVAPTSHADDLASQVGDALDRAEDALATMQARSTNLSGSVHIAGPAELMAERVAPFLKPLLAAGLDIRVHLGGKASLYEMLLDGQVDLAFTASTPEDARLAAAFVGSERLLAVAAPDMARRIGAGRDLAAALEAEPLIAYDTDRPLIRDWCKANGVALTTAAPVATAPDIRLVRNLVEASVGWSVVPDYLSAKAILDGRLQEIPAPRETPQNDFFLVWARSALRHPRVAHARRVLLEAWQAPSRNMPVDG
ncbi:MAG: LysR family transcriptional regulator [Pseudomonadota bacterium]